ncbi:hypothetical protein N7470_005484 [Penicillium chermesinum]|nr:hypothetical protein N7470_005484 [Penicillium chermesinum]
MLSPNFSGNPPGSPEVETEDVPVNKITSFHGRLNHFIHTHSNPPAPGPRPSSDNPSDDLSKLDSSLSSAGDDTEDLAGKKRSKRRTATTSNKGRQKPARSKAEAKTTDIYQTHPRRSPRSQKLSSALPHPTRPTTRKTTTKRTPKRKRPAPTPAKLTSLLEDTIPANLILLLVGLNPGIMTATTSFAYAHPSNLFWRLLHSSGITPIRHPPSDTYRLPELYSVGNTNIVARPTRNGGELTKAEMDAGVPELEAKIAAQKPEAVCIVGKSIWEAIWRVRHRRPITKEEFRYGWQDESENMGRKAGEEWGGAPVFVATTTSGLAASMSVAEKEAIWAELGKWVVQRREERGMTMVASE